MKNKSNIEEIIEVIFNGRDEKLFDESRDLIKVLILNTDDAMKKYLNLDLKKILSDEIHNIRDLTSILEMIPRIVNDFQSLKIIKHNNLNEYTDHIIEMKKMDYLSYISFIEKYRQKFSKVKIDCYGNEIIAEICFLLVKKIYVREIENLKSIKKQFEKEIIKNLIYEEISSKLNEILQQFEERFNNNNTLPKLTKLIENKFLYEGNIYNLILDKVKIF